MPNPFVSPRFAAVDSYGNPLVGGRLYTYANNTTTPQTTYKDSAGTIANTNPIILDSRGEGVIFLTEGLVYTWVLKDANDALIWSQSGIVGSEGGGTTLPVYPTPPASDVGSPVYIIGIGWANWNGSKYVTDYSAGFGSGAYSYRNKIINGSFRVWQRGLSIGPITSATPKPYTADRWLVLAGGPTSVTVSRQTAGTDYRQNGPGAYSARVTSNTAATVAAANQNAFLTPIEGLNTVDLGLGTLWGGFFTLSFWVKASIVGTYSLAVTNGGAPVFRSYVSNFSIANAGAWEFKSLTIPVDPSDIANWNRTTGTGLQVLFDLGSGANLETGALNTWQTGQYYRTPGTVRMVATNASTFELSQVQLEIGSQATPFETMPYDTELRNCYRYYFNASGSWFGFLMGTSDNNREMNIYSPAVMRVAPTAAITASPPVSSTLPTLYGCRVRWNMGDITSSAEMTGFTLDAEL